MKKAPFEHQMGMVTQVLVHMCTRKSEVSKALWLPIEKAVERLTLATPSVAELQEVVYNSSALRNILAETTIPKSTTLVVDHMPPLWHHEPQNKPMTALQLA